MTTTPTTTVLWLPEVAAWYAALDPAHQAAVDYSLEMLRQHGVALRMPHAKKVVGAVEPIIELRPSSRRFAMRLFYAFDPNRSAVILLAGDKKGQADENTWTAHMAGLASKAWDGYLRLNGWRK